MKLYEFQEKGVKKLLQRKYMLLADEMGLGKTVQALEAAKRAQGQVLVVCPAFLKNNWYDEARKHCGHDFAQDMQILSYTSLNRMKFPNYDFDVVICDEAHYLKNPKSNRTGAFFSFLHNVKPEYLFLLTGTPIKNRVGEFWTLLKMLSMCPSGTNGIKMKMNYWEFQRHFMDMYPVRVRGQVIQKFQGMRNIPELKRLLRDKYLRRLADKVDLPPLTRKHINLKCSTEKKEEDLEAAWGNYNGGKKNSHLMTVKAVHALAKAPRTKFYVNDLIDQGEQIVLFTDHVDVVKYFKTQWGHNCAAITGSTSMDDRDRAVKNFQAGVIHTIVATIGTLSTGVTLTASSNLVFNDYPWVPADLLQAEKRIHRIGQTRRCTIHYLFSSATDFKIFKQIEDKLKVITEVV